ncbi:pyrokinin-1 receptor-like [Paramacrobiotus metropolitanus]|uniref:pyrokinin-1 receptor-like n=1 Tax=Paramacrobiotus metropolitanus TaxID=2943436 RepID=UPI002445656C|nr:pyrokinin-1 receptor-like [Paramacrobiotus metropolitanus]XP_055336678.1 pyrokinin-1 receptor-like [Paramacrobiotus metropolitanus]
METIIAEKMKTTWDFFNYDYATSTGFLNFTDLLNNFSSTLPYNYSMLPVNLSPEDFQKRVMVYLEDELLGPQRSATPVLIPMCFFYVLIFITGIVGNSVTIWVISRNPRMHTGGTNYYLINLAISDLISLILGLPFEVYQLFEEYPYPFAEQFCQARAWVSEASTLSSVFTILAFTVERYIAICHPFKNIHFRTKSSRVILTIIVSWILAFTAAGPMGLEFGIMLFPYPLSADWASHLDPTGVPGGQLLIPESAVCTARAEGPMAILIQFSTFAFFFLPMFVIIALHVIIAVHLRRSAYLTARESAGPEVYSQYTAGNGMAHVNSGGGGGGGLQPSSQMSQGRQSVLRMLVAVALAFFVCYAPHHAQRMHAVYEKNWNSDNMHVHRALTYISGVFYYGASTVNPFLYSILSARFRKAYRSTLCYCFFRRHEHFQRENFSAHSFNSQACSLRYRPSTSNDELTYLGTRQNSLDKNGLGRVCSRNASNGTIMPMPVPMNLLWTAPKYLVPVPTAVGEKLVIYYPKKKKTKRSKGKKSKKPRAKPVKAAPAQDDASSISGSSLQENHIDPEQVSDFLMNGAPTMGRSVTTPRLIVHPPSSSGSAKSEC